MIFVIEVDEDGDMQVRKYSWAQFEMALNASEEDLNLPPGIYPLDPEKLREGLEDSDYDPMYWGKKSILAIRGEIVQIKAVERVTRWEIK